MKGKVYWITGLSGSGKTTLGNALFYRLREKADNVVILDGDIVKDIVSSGSVSYSNEARRHRAYQYSHMCKMLSDQGITVVCCCIAMFHEVRQWNRENIENYIEIFVKVDINILIDRDAKGLYSGNSGEMVVGMNVDETEYPLSPDITICNTMDNKVDEYIDTIASYIRTGVNVSYAYRDYWDGYYTGKHAPNESSDFARFAFQYMQEGKKLFDLGCGNGRDSIYFAMNGLAVTAIDLSSVAIQELKEKSRGLRLNALCDDFVKARSLFAIEHHYYYSRWSLHSINKRQQDELLDNVYWALPHGGKFLIEARTVNDNIYGLGDKVEDDAFIFNGHYRRFVRRADILSQLEDIGFKILYEKEDVGFSATANDDPTLIRIVAEKLT